MDARFNRFDDPAWRARLKGAACLAFWLILTAAVTLPLDWLGRQSVAFLIGLIILAASLPAQKSLYAHVKDVADALEGDSLDAARLAVGRIVGRKTEVLDASGVARAAIESLAENFSDGVVAPAFWVAIGGLTGGALYKVINTADSMIGHLSPRHRFFGWASARLDDLVNLPASRLAALYLCAAAMIDGFAPARAAARTVFRDATHHRSPNAGWPEAAVAGALGLKLAGPRLYEEGLVEDAFMGDGRRDATAKDVRHALTLMRRACAIQFIVYAALAIGFIARS